MNLAETSGSSSRNAQENGDALNESERPLKKARFAWQVKGKYHLKNDTLDHKSQDTSKASTATVPEPDKACSSDSTINDKSKRETEQNIEIIEDYLLKRDFTTPDSVFTSSDQSVLLDKPSVSYEKLPSYPTYVSSYEKTMLRNGIRRTSESSNDLKMVPMSMVFPQNYTEEQCIARWQTKQMVKGFVDNSINHILDFWMQHPLPAENEPFRFIALDVADFINNLPGDNSVENEGILMAISAHGLQNPTSSNSSNFEDCNFNNTHDNSNVFPMSSIPSDDESHDINNHSDTDNALDMQWSYKDRRLESDDLAAFQLFPDNSLPYPQVSDSNQNSSVDCDSIQNSADNDCEFLDAAILFAIQSKGLTTFGSEYG